MCPLVPGAIRAPNPTAWNASQRRSKDPNTRQRRDISACASQEAFQTLQRTLLIYYAASQHPGCHQDEQRKKIELGQGVGMWMTRADTHHLVVIYLESGLHPVSLELARFTRQVRARKRGQEHLNQRRRNRRRMAASVGTWNYENRKQYESTWKLGGVLEPTATSQQNASARQWGEKRYAVDINDIALELFVHGRPSGTTEMKNYKSLCPFASERAAKSRSRQLQCMLHCTTQKEICTGKWGLHLVRFLLDAYGTLTQLRLQVVSLCASPRRSSCTLWHRRS